MERRVFLSTMAGGLIASPFISEAQQPRKIARIGFLNVSNATVAAPSLEALRQGLRELGWTEGQNMSIEGRWADGKEDRLPDLAGDLVRSGVDVIVAGGTLATRAAKQATQTLPIVMVGPGDPVISRLVESLSRPGGNVTGVSSLIRDLQVKYAELLKEALPKLSRVAVLWGPPIPRQGLKEVEEAAKPLNITLQFLEVHDPVDYQKVFAAITKGRAEALIVLPATVAYTDRALIANLAAKKRLPTMSSTSELVEAGLLMSYGPRSTELWRRSAVFVDKILKGAKPADLPIEQPTKFELVINLKTAKAIGLTIPQALRGRADQVIQ
jgi:putative ABC transport system substrate-binding protein